MTVIRTLSTRIGQKMLAAQKSQAELDQVEARMALWEVKADTLRKGVAQKQEEIDALMELKIEADALMAKRTKLQVYTDGLLEKFNAIPWRPDMDWSEKIESTDYQEKVDERHAINERLAEIEREANKTYFRR